MSKVLVNELVECVPSLAFIFPYAYTAGLVDVVICQSYLSNINFDISL